MAKEQYRYLVRLIEKITRKDFPSNTSFLFYGHHIDVLSGCRDFISVSVHENSDTYSREIASFDFDFDLKDLVLEGYLDDEMKEAIIQGFKRHNRRLNVIDDCEEEDCEEDDMKGEE